MLLKFLETINLECAHYPHEHPKKKALRLDRKGKEGLRCQVGIGDQWNCCDYLLPNRNKLILIEISDLITQLNALKEKQRETPKFKIFLKEPQKYIHQELKIKILGSLLILFKLPTQFKIDHEKLHHKRLEIIFVICSEGLDDVRVFEYLRTDLSNALKPLLKEVKIVNIPMFQILLTEMAVTKFW